LMQLDRDRAQLVGLVAAVLTIGPLIWWAMQDDGPPRPTTQVPPSHVDAEPITVRNALSVSPARGSADGAAVRVPNGRTGAPGPVSRMPWRASPGTIGSVAETTATRPASAVGTLKSPAVAGPTEPSDRVDPTGPAVRADSAVQTDPSARADPTVHTGPAV